MNELWMKNGDNLVDIDALGLLSQWWQYFIVHDNVYFAFVVMVISGEKIRD